jgi:FAD:protein FMN transferase
MEDEEAAPSIEERSFKCLGTDISIRLVVAKEQDVSEAETDLLKAQEIFEEAKKRFSRFDVESELSVLNDNLGHSMKASPEMLFVAKESLRFYELTEGIFDPRIITTLEKAGYDRDFDDISKSVAKVDSQLEKFDRKLSAELLIENDKLCFLSRLDFSGIVKGYAADKVAAFLSEKGWKNFFVDSGGDIFFAGKDEEGKPWYVDIEGIPFEKIMLSLSNEAVATSGIGKRKWEKQGERFHHIINPKKLTEFSFDLKSVTVVAEKTEDADVWAKTIFALGKSEGMECAKKNKLACAILGYRGEVWLSLAMQNHLYKKDE